MLTLQPLGTPQILFDSVPVVLPFKRAEALLYYLAAERSAIRQEHIALLWESDDETKGRKNLRHALYTGNLIPSFCQKIGSICSRLQMLPIFYFISLVKQHRWRYDIVYKKG